jgi:hypothetical protein
MRETSRCAWPRTNSSSERLSLKPSATSCGRSASYNTCFKLLAAIDNAQAIAAQVSRPSALRISASRLSVPHTKTELPIAATGGEPV